jgi:hypothetical protein
MKELSFERSVRSEPARLLQRVEKSLAAQGYEVSARSNFELSLVGAGTGGRHRLTVRCDGQTARFVFAAGSPGVTLPAEAELQRRVDAALQELGATPAAPVASASGSGGRCSICAGALAPTDRVCPVCGMTTG